MNVNNFGWGFAVGLVVALVFAILWGRSELKTGRAEVERDTALTTVAYVSAVNADLRTVLTDRQAVEEFMNFQRDAYISLVDRLVKINPRQIRLVKDKTSKTAKVDKRKGYGE